MGVPVHSIQLIGKMISALYYCLAIHKPRKFCHNLPFKGENMKLSSGLLGLLLLGAAGLASAQTMKPGLWEVNTKMQGQNGGADMSDAMAKAQKRMESLPPEQRKMVQDMMAKQGIQMSSNGTGGGMTIKMCLTQEMVERNEITSQHTETQKDCTHTRSPRSGNTMQFSFTCTNPARSGEGTVTFTSPEAYSMTMDSTSTIHGAPQKMSMQTNSRWLGSDCGDVKPRALPSK